jgi:hypothetical protein
MREPPSPSPLSFFFHSTLGFPPSLKVLVREVHKLRDLCKDSRILYENGGHYHLVSFGIWFVMNFWWFVFCSLRSYSSLSRSCLDSSFWDCFDSFLLCWSELWRELNLSTEGNHPIPHEFIDWDESSSRVSFSCSSEFLDFPLIGFKLGNDLLGVAHILHCDHVVKIWWQLVLIWL